MKTSKNILMIAIFTSGLAACQEEDLPQPIGSGISIVPNAVSAAETESDVYRTQGFREGREPGADIHTRVINPSKSGLREIDKDEAVTVKALDKKENQNHSLVRLEDDPDSSNSSNYDPSRIRRVLQR